MLSNSAGFKESQKMAAIHSELNSKPKFGAALKILNYQ